MAPADKLEQAAVECSPHLIELREFFASREIAFGSAAALAPFLDRLRNDRRFHDEMASMVRAIIYRTRDGVAPSELSDLVFRAVAGDEVYRLSKPRDEISSFIEDVFRSRWRTVPETMEVPELPQDRSGAEHSAPADAGHTTGEPLSTHRHPADNMPSSGEHLLPHQELHATQPGSARYESAPAWAGKLLEDPYDSEPTSRRWVWGAVFAALVFVFCAGLFFAQRTAVDVFQRGDPHVRAIGTAPHPTLAPTAQSSHPVEPAQTFDPLLEPAKPTAGRPLDPQPDRTARMSEVNSRSLAQRVVDPRATVGVSPALMRHRLIYAPPTDYPRIAKLTHIQGKVVVEAVVSRNGEVTHADVISGHRLLRGAALRAVRQRKYRPYIVDGRPQTVATLVTVDFRLR